MTSPDIARALEAELEASQFSWLKDASKLSGERFLAAFVGAGRRLGGAPCQLAGGQSDMAKKPWTMRLLGRVYLLLQFDQAQGADAQVLIQRAFREGDSREKEAIMSALPWLSASIDYKDLALDAGRSNEAALFASVALHNAYPAEHYSEAEFNQLVMKAAFQDLNLGEISGLESRANKELARMGMDYIDERLAAGRAYPSSLWLAIAPHAPAGAVARMLGELHHSQPERRLGATRGLLLCRDSRALSFLQERLPVETTSDVRDAITQSITALEGIKS